MCIDETGRLFSSSLNYMSSFKLLERYSVHVFLFLAQVEDDGLNEGKMGSGLKMS